MSTRKEELKKLLERLNSGEAAEKVKAEARELLEKIDPKELSEAEQALLDEGLPETELRNLCVAHLEVMSEELEGLKAEVSVGHPLHTFLVEHDEILNILDRLEEANNKIQKMESYNKEDEVFQELQDIGKGLLETQNHHAREEDALFPEVDKTGVTGPTRIMKMEHEDLWPHKKRIEEMARNVTNIDFNYFKEELNEHAKYVVLNMRDHIFKENNILYPTAKQVLSEDSWEVIKKIANEIGYCSFTPEEEYRDSL